MKERGRGECPEFDLVAGRLAAAKISLRSLPDHTRAAVALVVGADGDGCRVLFIERAAHPQDPWSGNIGFPGGKVEEGDDGCRRAAERETLEESGYRVQARKILAQLDKSRHEHPPSVDYTYKVLIACELLGGEPTTSHEVDAVGFFPRSALPPLDLERTTPGQVDLAFVHAADPERPTDFD